MFIISDLILNIFKPFCFSVMPFSSTPNITQNLLISLAFDTSFRLTPPPLNYAYIFSWSKSKILFFVNSSILCKSFYFIVFCRHPCFGYSVTGFNRFFFFLSPCTTHLTHSIFVFYSIQVFPKILFPENWKLSEALYISLNPTFPSWLLFLPMLFFLQPYPFCHSKTCSPNQIVRFCNALAF